MTRTLSTSEMDDGMNIRDLAKALGLSTSTVSRALNGYTDVNAQTRLRVQEMAQSMGYSPDAGARRLVRGKTDAIGIVYSAAVENLGNPLFLDMAGGLAERLEQDHFDLLLAVAKNDSDLNVYDRLFRGGRVDAVIVPNTLVQDERIDHLQAKGYPFIAYGRTQSEGDFSWFDFDNEQGSALAVEHLVGLGHTRIAYVHAALALNFAYQRHAGFVNAMRKHGFICPAECMLGGVADKRGGFVAVSHLLALADRPTAIVVDNNLAGIGVVRGLLDAGIDLGKEMSVLVHGELPNDSLLSEMSITLVTQPTAHDSGVTMAEMVLKLLKGIEQEHMHVLRQSNLTIGSTTGPVPVR
jgi:LacI family transcriptional regulator